MAAKVAANNIKLDYDQEADVRYISFGKPAPADDSYVTDEGVVIRTRADRIVGLTILNARQRLDLSRAA